MFLPKKGSHFIKKKFGKNVPKIFTWTSVNRFYSQLTWMYLQESNDREKNEIKSRGNFLLSWVAHELGQEYVSFFFSSSKSIISTTSHHSLLIGLYVICSKFETFYNFSPVSCSSFLQEKAIPLHSLWKSIHTVMRNVRSYAVFEVQFNTHENWAKTMHRNKNNRIWNRRLIGAWFFLVK